MILRKLPSKFATTAIFIALFAATSIAVADLLPPNWDSMSAAEKAEHNAARQRMNELRKRDLDKEREKENSTTATRPSRRSSAGSRTTDGSTTSSGTHDSDHTSTGATTVRLQPGETL